MKRIGLVFLFLCCSAVAQIVGIGGVQYVYTAPSGTCVASAQIQKVVSGAGTTYACQTIVNGIGTWTALASGSATGTVTSIGLAGTANQITVTGATPVTGSGAWTLSLPSAMTLPGTLTVTGNTTLNMSGGPFCVHETAGVLAATAADCGGGISITVNAGSALTTPINFQNGTAVNGITINASNPSGSNVQFALSGTLANNGLANSATTPNGQTCTLGSTCNVNIGATTHGVALNEGNGSAIGGTAVGATGIPLIGQTGADPVFGTATVPGGGTGATTFTQYGVLLGEATGAVQATSAGTQYQFLISNGSANPGWSSWQMPSTGGTNAQCLTSNGTNAVWGSCSTGSVGTGGGTANAIAKFTAASTVNNSLLTDNATILAYTGTGGLQLTAGPVELTEIVAPSGIGANDLLYGDSTAHRLKVNNNNGGATTIALFTDNLSVFASTTSAQLRGVISDPTGTGANVFATSPTLVTPTLGVAQATSVQVGSSGVLGTFILGNATSGLVTLETVTGALGTVTDYLPAGGTIPALTGTAHGVKISQGTTSAETSTAAGASNMPLIGQGAADPIYSTIAYPTSATSGGLLYLSSATQISSSTAQTTHGVWLAEGAGNAPVSTAAGTSGYALVSGGASADPAYAQLASAALNITTTACTNQVVTAISSTAAGTCTSLASTYLPLSSMGTITGGTWNGTGITVAYGGTGVATVTAHSLVIGEGTSAFANTGAGTQYQFLISNGAADPGWSSWQLPSTGGSNNQCLTSNGTNSVWGSCSTGSITGASLTSTQVAVATGSSAITSYSGFTSDSSGNVTANTLTIGAAGAGIIGIAQGTAQGTGTTSVGLTAPTSVTSYNVVVPSAASAGTNASSGNFYVKVASSQNQTGCTASGTELCGYFETAINLASGSGDITGTLPPASGGSGVASPTAHTVLLGEGSSAFGTVSVGATGTVLIGNSSADPSFATTLALGNSGNSGIITVAGSSSGVITLQPQAAAGTYNWNWPATAGSNGQCLVSAGGGSSVMTWGSCGGSVLWSGLSNPTGALSLAMAGYTTTMTYGSSTGAATNLFNITDTASNTGTGFLLSVMTAASSAASAVQFGIEGNNGFELIPVNSGANQQAIFGVCATAPNTGGTVDQARQVQCAATAATTANRILLTNGSFTGVGHQVETTSAAGTYKLYSARVGVNADGTIGSGAEIYNVLANGTITLGTAGANVGTVTMYNATSGSVSLVPTTGALGTVTASLPANTGTIAELNLAQTFSALQTFGSNASIAGTAHGVLLSENTGAVVATAAGTSNMMLASGGASADGAYKSWADLDSTQYVAGGGTAQAQTATLAPPATALVNGLEVNFLPLAANTAAAPTLAVNGLAAKPITKLGTTALVANDLTTTAIASVIYDGTEWQLQNPQTTSVGGVSSVNTLTGAVVIEAATAGQVAISGGNAAALTGAADMTYSTHTFATTANGIFDWSAATGAASLKLPAVTGGTQLTGTVTANLSAPAVFQNTNSTNNNTSITMGITAPGTSTGQTVLNINGASTGGDLQDWGTGGTWSAGVLSGQTIVASVTIAGEGKFGASAPAPTIGTSGGWVATEGTAFTGTSTQYGEYNDSTLHCVDIIDQTSNLGCAVGEASIIGANLIPKASGTTSGIAASSITDDGKNITTSEVFVGGNKTFVTSDYTDSTSGSLQAITGLSYTLPTSKAVNVSFHCVLMFDQGTAAVVDQFGIGVTGTAPTQANAVGRVWAGASGAWTSSGVLTALASTTPTSVVSFTPSAITTIWSAELDGTIEQPSNATPGVFNVYAFTTTGTDNLIVKRGSYCEIF